MRRGREKKVRGQNARDKRGDHARQADEQNGTGVQGNIPRRTGARTAQTELVRNFWYCVLACLHWKGKRREIFGSVRNWLHGGGTENEALLIPPHCQPATPVQCPHFFIPVPDPKTFRRTQGPQKCF